MKRFRIRRKRAHKHHNDQSPEKRICALRATSSDLRVRVVWFEALGEARTQLGSTVPGPETGEENQCMEWRGLLQSKALE